MKFPAMKSPSTPIALNSPMDRLLKLSNSATASRRRTLTVLGLVVTAAVSTGHLALAANTEDDVKAAATDLGINTTVTYNAVAGTTSDVTFAAATTYTNAGSLLLNNGALSIGTLDDLNASAISITGTQTLTLNGGTNVVAPTAGGNAADLLFVQSGANLTLNTSAAINIVNSGNVDAIGTLSLGTSPITITAGKVVTFTGAGAASVGGNIGATTGAVTVNDGAGSVTLSGNNSYTGATTLTGGTLNLTGTETASAIAVNGGTFNESSTGVISGGGVTFTQSSGVSTLSGANTYTGATTITSGTLDLGGSTASGSISASSPLSLGGGTLNYTRTGGATQTFASTALTAGGSVVNVAAGNTLNLNAITRSAGGTVNFGTTGAITTTTPNANGIIGGYATIGGANFAVSGSGGATTALTTYDATFPTVASDIVTTDNVNETGGTTLSASSTINSLTISDAGNNTLALGANNLTFTPGGGLLYAGNGSGGGSYTISGTGIIGASSTNEFIANVNGGATLTISAKVVTSAAAAGSLTKGGAGTLILTANNVYTGPTVVGAGTLQIGNATATTLDGGTYAGAVTNNGALVFNSTSGNTFSGIISGVGSLSENNTGGLTLSGPNTYTGITTITGGGAISISSDANLGTAPASFVANQLTLDGGTLAETGASGATTTLAANRGITLGAGGGTLNANPGSADSIQVNGIITGPGALTVISSNASNRRVFLNGQNTFAGGVLLGSNYALEVGSNTALGTGTLTFGTANNGNTPLFRLDNVTIANPITVTAGGSRNVQENVGGNATISGPITLVGGTGSFVNPTINFGQSQAGSTLFITGGFTGMGNVAFAGGINGRSNANVTISGSSVNNVGTISNTEGSDTGTDTISAVIGTNVTGIIQNSTKTTLVLSNSNSFFGDTTLTNGTINLQNANALANSVVVTNSNAGVLTFGSGGTNITTAQIGGLSGTGSATAGSFGNIVLVNNGSSAGPLALSIGNSNAANGSVSNPNTLNPTYSGIISGAGSITKVGSNTQTFAGTETYTGATNVNVGKLLVSGSLTSTGSVSVGANATLAVNGLVNTAATITSTGGTVQGQGTIGTVGITTSGTLAPGFTVVNNNPGTLTSTGSVTLDSSSAFNIRLGVANLSGTDGDALSATAGTVTLNSATLNITPGATLANAPAGTLYNIIIGAAGATTNGLGTTNFFGNAVPTGGIGTITSGQYTFNVIYGTDGSTSGTPLVGNDVTLQLTSVPEPQTWAMLLSGVGVLGMWQRSRRRGTAGKF